MINILKPFEALGIRFHYSEFEHATRTLTFYYVLSTAVILVISSVAVLAIFAPPETELPFQTETVEYIEIEHDDWSMYEIREHLAVVIVSVDFFILLIVSVLSYFFAQRTLLPIRIMHEKQRQFMSDVAHELRTPLSVMLAGTDAILRRPRTALEYESFVADVQDEAARLTRVSNQLLQLLKTGDKNAREFSLVVVSEVLEAEIRRFATYATKYGITLTGTIAPHIEARTNQDALIEIVQNLLKNAIDYTPQGGNVLLTLTDTNTSLKISIQDTGVGIPKEQQASIFGRFNKVTMARTPTKESGVGLGLAIVAALVRELNGQLTLESEVGVGTNISIVVPKNHS